MPANHSFLKRFFADEVQTFNFRTLTVVNTWSNNKSVIKVTIPVSKMQYDIETATKIAENWLTGETAWAIIPHIVSSVMEERSSPNSHMWYQRTVLINQMALGGGIECAPSYQKHISLYISRNNLILLFSSTFNSNWEKPAVHSHLHPQTRKHHKHHCWLKPALITGHHHHSEMNMETHQSTGDTGKQANR